MKKEGGRGIRCHFSDTLNGSSEKRGSEKNGELKRECWGKKGKERELADLEQRGGGGAKDR